MSGRKWPLKFLHNIIEVDDEENDDDDGEESPPPVLASLAPKPVQPLMQSAIAGVPDDELGYLDAQTLREGKLEGSVQARGGIQVVCPRQPP